MIPNPFSGVSPSPIGGELISFWTMGGHMEYQTKRRWLSAAYIAIAILIVVGVVLVLTA